MDGRLLRSTRSASWISWLWTLIGPNLVGVALRGCGGSETLGKSKTAMRETFDWWLVLSIEQGESEAWRG